MRDEKDCHQPILVYLCGTESSEIKSSLLHHLSTCYFVQTNQQRKNIKSYIDNCYAITSSSVFIFVMDRHSIRDQCCLSLLGNAVAFRIPIICVREIGYSLPSRLPKVYKSTEIIDRSQSNEYNLKNQQLPGVTTLESVLKTLFIQAVVFHKQIKTKCISEIKDNMSGLSSKTFIRARTLYNTSDDEEEIKPYGQQRNPAEQHKIKIKPWPNIPDQSNVTTLISPTPKGGTVKTPTLGTDANFKLGDQSTNKFFLNGTLLSKSQIKSQVASKYKIRIYTAPQKSILPHHPKTPTKGGRTINNTEICSNSNGHACGNNNGTTGQSKRDNERKERSATTTVTHEKTPLSYHLRRQSSLPCITTNYMVASESGKSKEPQVYHFPMSPRLIVKQQSYRSSISKLTDEDDDNLPLSIVCSPIGSDDEIQDDFIRVPVVTQVAKTKNVLHQEKLPTPMT